MPAQFTNKTFQYFDLASKNKNNEKWFLKNKSLYENEVKEPFSILIQQLDLRFGDKLSGIDINPKKISRPLSPKNKQEAGQEVVKSQAHVSLSEKKSSLFEWNPGLYIQVGKNENYLGSGLYMVSSRQIKLMRRAIVTNFDQFHALLQDKKLKKRWGSLIGDKYVRFPKDFDETHPSAQYIYHKQFFLGQEPTRKEVTDKKFFQRVGDDMELSLPFLQWIRKTVGTYEKKKFSFRDDD